MIPPISLFIIAHQNQRRNFEMQQRRNLEMHKRMMQENRKREEEQKHANNDND